ncbi:amidohydrolase [Solidesulfovibrio sp.]
MWRPTPSRILVAPGANLEVAIVGLIICNTGTVDTAAVTVTLTNSAGTVKATPIKASLDPGESVHIDTKIFIAASATPDKLRVLSTVATVSFLASGDEG